MRRRPVDLPLFLNRALIPIFRPQIGRILDALSTCELAVLIDENNIRI